MKYCPHCGAKLNKRQVACFECGASLNRDIRSSAYDDSWGLLGLFIPIVGLVLYIVWKDEKPLEAKAAGKGALISMILIGLIYILYFIIIKDYITS